LVACHGRVSRGVAGGWQGVLDPQIGSGASAVRAASRWPAWHRRRDQSSRSANRAQRIRHPLSERTNRERRLENREVRTVGWVGVRAASASARVKSAPRTARPGRTLHARPAGGRRHRDRKKVVRQGRAGWRSPAIEALQKVRSAAVRRQPSSEAGVVGRRSFW